MGTEIKPHTDAEFESLVSTYTIRDFIDRYLKSIKIIEGLVGASQLAELQDIENALKSIKTPREEIRTTLAAIRFLIEEY